MNRSYLSADEANSTGATQAACDGSVKPSRRRLPWRPTPCTLELLHVERRLAGARTTRTGEIAPLVGRREELRVRYDPALERAMEAIQAVDGG
jgi:hypothetical protein